MSDERMKAIRQAVATTWVRNPDGTYSKPAGKPTPAAPEIAPAKRIRQNAKPLLNKLETEWLAVLTARLGPSAIIHAQALRFRLANGHFYKPDFCAMVGTYLTAWEVKGPHAFRGGFENLKVAATLYPDIRWILVWKQDGRWWEQVVLS